MSTDKLINGIIFLMLGILLLIERNRIAKACKISKVKMFGVSKFDDRSEFIARFGIILIAVCFAFGGFLQVFQFIISK